MESMGISEDDLEEMNNQLMEYSQANETSENGEQAEGAESLFSFLQNQQNSQGGNQSESGATRVKEKKEQKPKRKFLTGFCEDLTAKARAGQLGAVIGRDKEIERVVQILSRRHEKQSLPYRRTRCRKNSYCRGNCHSHCKGTGARKANG